MTDPDLHFIRRLKVVPAVDTVGFSSRRNDRPWHALRSDGTTPVNSSNSWRVGQYRQQHQKEMSRFDGSGYPQDTTFDFRIVAMKYPPAARAHTRRSGGPLPPVLGPRHSSSIPFTCETTGTPAAPANSGSASVSAIG